jgi:hypothetical protein
MSTVYSVELHGLNFVYNWSYGSDETRFEPATPDEVVVLRVKAGSMDLTEAYDLGYMRDEIIIREITEHHQQQNKREE